MIKSWVFYLFKFLGLVLLRTFQEVEQYDVTQHCSLRNNNNDNNYNYNNNNYKQAPSTSKMSLVTTPWSTASFPFSFSSFFLVFKANKNQKSNLIEFLMITSLRSFSRTCADIFKHSCYFQIVL